MRKLLPWGKRHKVVTEFILKGIREGKGIISTEWMVGMDNLTRKALKQFCNELENGDYALDLVLISSSAVILNSEEYEVKTTEQKRKRKSKNKLTEHKRVMESKREAEKNVPDYSGPLSVPRILLGEDYDDL